MALVAAAKFQYGAFMSSSYFHINIRRLLRFFFDADQPWYVVIQQLTNHSVIIREPEPQRQRVVVAFQHE
jgi:hypothetical protein